MWSVVGGLTTVIWSVVGGRFFHSHWSVVGGSFGRWLMASNFLGKWPVVGSAWSVVGVTVIGGQWSVVCGWWFCTTPINYMSMSDRTSSTCSKCRPSRLGVSDFVCWTPQGLLTVLAYGGGGGVRMKDQIQTQNCISEIIVHDANAKFCF